MMKTKRDKQQERKKKRKMKGKTKHNKGKKSQDKRKNLNQGIMQEKVRKDRETRENNMGWVKKKEIKVYLILLLK